ncbi:hypothetical protein MTR_5g021780 [Medicago truncatula]|uniref:Uncharacterized protein n=1 Tax=Medicago truncatula TaxID=3880 RepID=G7JW52_MEDTR|nr:hypothetical protein MTR_5g021780 [Medicago truncatula]
MCATDYKITTITEQLETSDPILERLKSLKITPPILTNPPTEGSLTDILVRRPWMSQASATVNPKVLLKLFSMYRDWQEERVEEISRKQVLFHANKYRMPVVLSLMRF